MAFVVFAACAPAPLAHSVVLRNVSHRSLSGFELDAEECEKYCLAPRPGERLLWCHDSNMEKETVNPTTSLKDNEMVLVCNYGAK